MSPSGATYALGAVGFLAAASAARSWAGALNRPMLSAVPFRLQMEREGRGPNALRTYAWLPTVRLLLRTAAGFHDSVTVFHSPSGYQILAVHPAGKHLAWERYAPDGRLLDDRFLHGAEIAQVMGPSWREAKVSDLCSRFSSLSARAEYGQAI